VRGRAFVVIVVIGIASVIASGVVGIAPSPAVAAGPGQYGPPEWWPLRGDNLVGCTRNSPDKVGGAQICKGNYHPVWAIDLEGSQGQAVYASGAGLAKIHTNSTACSGLGRSVVVEHGGRTKSLYAHLSRFSPALAANPNGTWVDEDSIIGFVGHTGNVSNCSYNHLHYEETTNGRFWGRATDPGPLKACKGGRLVTYPQAWGQPSWNELRGHSYVGRHDGTSCRGIRDFTGDRLADIAWYEQGQNAITVLKSTGSSFDGAWKQAGIGGPTWAGVGDFTGDGLADVAWYEQWNNAITVFKSTGSGFTFAFKRSGIGGPTWAGVGDFTGDGLVDIAWYEQWQSAITILKSTGSSFTAAGKRSGIGGPSWAGVGDFTGDGLADLAWYEHWQNAITILKSTGNSFTATGKRSGVGGPSWAGVGDFTGDGLADVAWYEHWQNAITVLKSTGKGFTGAWKLTGTGGPSWAGVGDFTGDGLADLAWYEHWQNAITILKSTGSSFTAAGKRSGIGAPTWAGVT
jgi:hypothetical protein